VALESGQISGYEALVRWNHPTRGLVLPGDFIPIAEENGFILLLGWWVLETACRQLQTWNQARTTLFPGARAHFMSVNLSSKQFSQPDMIEHVARIVERTGADPRHLTLEITESVIMEHTESASASLRRLRQMGIHLSMDDFGTGYSSLSYLHRFSLDTLKIDRSFISQMRPGAREGEIVGTILSLANSLSMKVVAEGVETAEQLAGLRRMGCGFAQGFLFSKPFPAEKIENLWRQAPIW
jgi:EAL domain-containing protein (putative c-di-GMP-specific phosphodiesterase class I)